jgi:hypothetical protein
MLATAFGVVLLFFILDVIDALRIEKFRARP